MAFGVDIKRLREESSISAQKLADIMGVDANRLRKWEQNDSTPRHEDVLILETFFGLTLEEVGKLKSIKKFLNVPPKPLEHNANNSNMSNGKTIYSFNMEAQKVVSEHEERLLRLEATLEVYENAIAGLLSKKPGDFKRNVSELREEVAKAVNRRFDELIKKRKL